MVRDVRPQKMLCYENDSLVAEFIVSTGKKGFETALGRYCILTKKEKTWSRKWKCWMLYWQSITEPRPLRNGIHALEGDKYEKKLGFPASHGCIRLSRRDAEWLFKWTEIGDSVLIVKNWDR
ncbi:MAG: L,D-transpeptidase [Patescibacteria group bacterium]